MHQMWDYPKSQLHQAAINEAKPERDREALRAVAADLKLRREREAAQAIKDHEAQRIATLAKTQRLRAERLARLEMEPQKPKRGAVRSRSGQSPKS